MITTREILSTGVTLEELKQHLRITNTIFDSDLEQKLRAAHLVAEHYIGQTLMPSRVVEVMEAATQLSLAAPVASIISVKLNGEAIPYSLTGNVVSIAQTAKGPVEVTYLSGHDAVAYDIKVAILLIAADLFENPVDRVEQLPRASQMLLRPYRSYGTR